MTVNGGFTLDRNVIPEMDVSRAQMDALGYTQVLEALQQVPSVVIQHPDAGAPTAPAVVSLRGPDPSEAMVTLDGQQLNDGNTGDIDLSQFAVPAFNSVNVTEGLGPTDAEGSNTFGGAVNFVSLRPTQDDHLNFSGVGRLVRHDAELAQRDRDDRQARLRVRGQRLSADGSSRIEYAWVVPANNLPDLLRTGDEDEDAELSVLHAPRLDDRGDARARQSRLQFLAARRRGLSRLYARRQSRRVERAQRYRRQPDVRL